MKKYFEVPIRIAVIVLTVACGGWLDSTPPLLAADDGSEKIRLMAEMLRARDSGDLLLAKEKAEALIKFAPDDENVQRLLGAINNDLDRRNRGTAVYGQAPNLTPESAIERSALEGMPANVISVAKDQNSQ